MSVYLKRVQLESVEEYEENPSVYCKRVEVVEVVDENNNIWTFDPLKIADNGGSNWVGGNVYEVGETVTAKTSTYTGGKDPVTYRYIFAMRDDASSPWVAIDGGFKPTTNAKNSVTVVLPRAGQVALQSDAVDSSFPPIKVDSDTGPRTVTAPATNIGTVVITPDAAALAAGIEQEFTASVSGGSATNLMFNWTVRSGDAV